LLGEIQKCCAFCAWFSRGAGRRQPAIRAFNRSCNPIVSVQSRNSALTSQHFALPTAACRSPVADQRDAICKQCSGSAVRYLAKLRFATAALITAPAIAAGSFALNKFGLSVHPQEKPFLDGLRLIARVAAGGFCADDQPKRSFIGNNLPP
jgi:hypothetical protein